MLQSFLGSGEEDFKVLLPNIVMAAVFFDGVKPLKQIVNTLSSEGPNLKSGENCSSGFRE